MSSAQTRQAATSQVLIALTTGVLLVIQFLWSAGLSTEEEREWLRLIQGSTAILGCVAYGLSRSVSIAGRVDVLHPLVFPLIYVAASFLVPVWVTFALGRPVGSLNRDTAVATNVIALLAVGVISFACGAAVPFRGVDRHEFFPDDGTLGHARRVRILGRILALISMGLAVSALARGGVEVRGLGQGQYSFLDSIAVVTNLFPSVAVTLLVAGHAAAKSTVVISRVDWVLIGSMVAFTAMRGSRNAAVAAMIVLMAAYIARGYQARSLAIGLCGILAFMVAVLRYRNQVLGTASNNSAWESVLGDMAPAGYSTGVIAAMVPLNHPYEGGATLVAAIFRQLPSPIAVRILGPPDDTGAAIFRDLLGLNSQVGLGFSLTADGYLNFGLAGIIGTCFALGLLFAWGYSRFRMSSLKGVHLFYLILVSALPMALRADYLGGIKGWLYPVLLVSISLMALRGSERRTRRF